MPYFPTAPQAAFLLLPHQEVLFGGAAGPGKSTALLMASLQYVDVPGYAAIIFRRHYTDLALPGALMEVAHTWLDGTDARWNGVEHTWTFPTGSHPATLAFGYLANVNDQSRYQSAQFQFCGFDELTQFRESQYRYLFSRLRRRADMAVPLRMRGASNPGGIGHAWVKQRFLTEGRTPGRAFLPARLADNPHLDRTAYLATMAYLDPLTRQQLLDGNWDAAVEGELFRREWFPIVEHGPREGRVIRYWDLAATAPKPGYTDPDWTVGGKVLCQRGQYWVLDVRRTRLTPKGVDDLVAQTAREDGPGVQIHIEQEGGASGKLVIDRFQRDVLPGYAVSGHPPSGDKVTRARPASSAAEAGNVLLVRGPWITAFLDELTLFPHGAHDDQVDMLSGAVAVLASHVPAPIAFPGGVTQKNPWR